MKYKFKTKPYSHQLAALEKSWNRETYAYFMEMGTGKTKVLIDNLAMLYDKGKVNGALIIAPKGVVGTWYNQEIPTHLPNHIENVTTLWQSNITKKQKESLDEILKVGEELHILIMNVEAFSTTKGVEFATRFLNSHRPLIAIDESTTIKNPKAKRTKNIINLSNLARYRRVMTGSPVNNKKSLVVYSFKDCLNLKIKGPGENIICESSGNKNLKVPYSAAPKILILGLPSLVPAISCITYTIGNLTFLLSSIDIIYKISYILSQ